MITIDDKIQRLKELISPLLTPMHEQHLNKEVWTNLNRANAILDTITYSQPSYKMKEVEEEAVRRFPFKTEMDFPAGVYEREIRDANCIVEYDREKFTSGAQFYASLQDSPAVKVEEDNNGDIKWEHIDADLRHVYFAAQRATGDLPHTWGGDWESVKELVDFIKKLKAGMVESGDIEGVKMLNKLQSKMTYVIDFAKECRDKNDSVYAAFKRLAQTLSINKGKDTEWVSCEERLPEVSKLDADFSDKVLCNVDLFARQTLAVGFYSHIQARWFVIGYKTDVVRAVTHWQPLPSTPNR